MPARLLGAQVKVEGEEHEEDEQRVFLGDAIVGDGVDAEGPERGGHERRAAIKKGGGQEKERDDRQRAEQHVGKPERRFVADLVSRIAARSSAALRLHRDVHHRLHQHRMLGVRADVALLVSAHRFELVDLVFREPDR